MKHKILYVISITGFIFSVVGCQGNTKIHLKKKTFHVEYGDRLSTKAASYVKGDQAILKNTKIKFKNMKYEKDKEYPKEGTYQAIATYENEKLPFKIMVKDTKEPIFLSFLKEIRIEQNAENFSIPDYYQAKDLHPLKINSKFPNIKWDTPGTYEGTVSAVDSAGNKATKSIKLIILSNEDIRNGAELTANINGKYAISKATQALVDQHELELHITKPDGSKETIGAIQPKNHESAQLNTLNTPLSEGQIQTDNHQSTSAPTPDPAPAPAPAPEVHYTLVKVEELDNGLTRFSITFKEEDRDIAWQEFKAWVKSQGYEEMQGGGGPTFGSIDAKKL